MMTASNCSHKRGASNAMIAKGRRPFLLVAKIVTRLNLSKIPNQNPFDKAECTLVKRCPLLIGNLYR